MKRENWFPLFVFFAVSLAYCSPVFKNFHYWGQMDWDQFTFWNAVPYETIFRYHQFPLWNPYANGGNVLLAHPHSMFLSPAYIFVLLFGPVIGLKILVVVHLFLGLWGMFLFAREHDGEGQIEYAAYLSAFVYMLSSIYALRMSEGQTEWFSLAYVPFVLLFFTKGLVDAKYLFAAIFVLGIAVFQGPYVFLNLIFFLGLYVMLQSWHARSLKPIGNFFFLLIGTFLFSAIKLIPVIEFISRNPRDIVELSGISFPAFLEMVFGRRQAELDILTGNMTPQLGLEYGWHEYGSYVGIFVAGLFVYGAITQFKKHWPMIFAGFLCLIVSFGTGFFVDLSALLHMVPVYKSLRVPSRFMFCFIFSVAFIAGQGFYGLERYAREIRDEKKRIVAHVMVVGILCFILFDLLQVNSPILKNAFRIKPIEVSWNEQFIQRYESMNFFDYAVSRSFQYPIFLSNSGIINAYECLSIPRGHVFTVEDPGYRGEAYLKNDRGSVQITSFSPNKIICKVLAQGKDVLLLNQNFDPGWKVRIGNQVKLAMSHEGLIAVPVDPGQAEVTFYYLPTSFILGLFVSLGFICSACFYFFVIRKR